MKNLKIYLVLLISLVCIQVYATEYSPDDIENPNIANRSQYVADPAGLVSQLAKNQANATLWNIRQKTGAEVVMVVVPNTGDYTEEDFATEIFEKWGVGKSDKDNGVLVLIVPDQRSARIATGYGVEGIIPDISANKIISRSIKPYMQNGDLDGAVVAVSSDLATVLTDPDAAAELKSSKGEAWEQAPQSDITTDDILGLAGIVVGFAFLFSIGKYIYDSRRLGKRDRYEMASGWHREQSTYLFLAIASLGLGLIPLWLAKRKYKRARNTPYKCPGCKNRMMHKLNEEEDNKYLSPSQDFEEKLNTVDYDVWVCDNCNTIERFAFPTSQMKYSKCPNCGTVAYCLVSDKTIVPPTQYSTGTGERTYQCKYCGNNRKDRYTIPRRAHVGAVAAGAALGSRGGFGGGGFGGGFGGGHTGGGGATGRW